MTSGEPGDLVLPVVVTAAHREDVLDPDDLLEDVEAGRFEVGLHLGGRERGVPDDRDSSPLWA